MSRTKKNLKKNNSLLNKLLLIKNYYKLLSVLGISIIGITLISINYNQNSNGANINLIQINFNEPLPEKEIIKNEISCSSPYVPGKIGTAFLVNECNAILKKDFKGIEGDTGTVVMLISPKWSQKENSYRYLFDWGKNIENDRISLFVDQDNKLNLLFFDSNGNFYGAKEDISSWIDDEWHMIMITWDFKSKEAMLYLDTQRVKIITIPNSYIDLTTENGLYIGQNILEEERLYGMINAYWIFSDVKSQDWMKALYYSIFDSSFIKIGN